MEPARLQVRALLSLLLGLLPPHFIMWMRQLHRTSEPGGARRRASFAILNILRHRHLDPSQKSVRIEELDLSLYNDNAIITKRLFYLGQYEGKEAYWWEFFCGRAGNIVEFGANTGLYSIIGARLPGVFRYTAIEPHPRCAEVLRRNLEINRVRNVTVVEAAVVGKEGPAKMELCVPFLDADQTPTGSSLVLDQYSHRKPRERVMVRTVPARPYVEQAELIKMDIEGQELNVLEAVQDILARTKPTIFLEVLSANLPLREYIQVLCRLCGYQVFAITEDGLRPLPPQDVPRVDHYARFGTRDLILTTCTVLTDMVGHR